MRRTAGVTHITVFTRPDQCGGNCLYCPKVPGLPKSYLPHSDIARHGLSYSSRDQVRHWIDENERRGGTGSKLEILVLGGSFTAHPLEYQTEFLKGIYLGVADPPAEGDLELEELVARHDASDGRRIIGITVESRPNLVTRELVRRLFQAGVTKIEIGVQSTDDEVLAFNDRGHGTDSVMAATAIIKEEGLKVGYHLLLGMPGASHDSDVASARRVFEDPAFQPDHLKIYFCEMFRREFMRERLVRLFDSGGWTPLDTESRIRLASEILPLVPPFTRISRIGRKIAGPEVEGGFRRLDRAKLERSCGCRCIRCREPFLNRESLASEVAIVRREVSEREFYFEARPGAHNVCLGMLRLRESGEGPVVRELHVYGREAAPGRHGFHQHRGIGKMLMRAAEEHVAGRKATLKVASGVGVREYYRRLGYELGADGMMTRAI